ncbi:MAG TPA: FtsX-like permease family protein [Bryobacteraceae bacterium]|nr:FtsX-like permease family protein [Bryobacteraceae bacterium]
MKLFHRLILRPLRRDRTRTILTLLSIALGVAVVIAIELSGDAATGSFESSLTTLVGKVDYEITANGGVDETYIAKLAALPVNARFSPVIEQPVVVAGGITRGASTTLYGIDLISTPAENAGDFDPEQLESTAVLSSDLAGRLGLGKGATIQLKGRDQTAAFTIRAIAANQNTEWIGVDIAAAQRLLDMYGKLDRIEVFLSPHENAPAVENRIRATVPATWDVQTPGARSEENRRMLRAFRWNLRILSYISLLVGAFLIYNTIAVSVVRRRTEIGILRALGTSSRGVLAVFLGEATMLGLIGSALGIVLGRLLAAALIGMISDTVNALFTTSAPGTIALSPVSILGALLTGTAVAFFSALIPAREAARVAPAEAMRRAIVEHETRLHARRDLGIAGIAAAIAAILCRFGPIGGRPVAGYIATLFAVAATALVAPAFVVGVVHALRGTLKRFAGVEGFIAARSLVASLSRTSIVVTALATAISMMISVGVMVGSFRETVEVWLASELRADIFMRAEGAATAGIYPPIAAAVPQIVEQTPGVGEVDLFHAFEIRYQGTRTTLGAGNMDIARRRRSLRFLSGSADNILTSLPGRDRAIVTEPFADKHHVHTGDVLKIPLGPRTVALTVAGIYYDYSSDRGLVLVDRSTLLKYLPNQAVTNIAVYTRPGADAAKVRRELEARLAAYPLMIAPNAVLRRGAVEVFDRTFAVTYALEAVAIVVAMLGAANSLLALVLDRRREIGLIRYLGAAAGQVRRMILVEAGLLGFLAGSLGLVLGMALSLVLIYVVNKQSFGWTIQFHPPVELLGGALLLVWIVTILAGVYPARFAAKLEPAEAVHEE